MVSSVLLLLLHVLLHLSDAVAGDPVGPAPIMRMDSMRQPGAPFGALVPHGARRRGVRGPPKGGPRAAPGGASSIEAQIAAIMSHVPFVWTTTWRPLVLAAAAKPKSAREAAYREVTASVDSFCQQQLEGLGLLQYAAAQKAVKAVVASLKDSILILLSLRASPGRPALSQKPIPPADPTLYDDPGGDPEAASSDRQQQQQRMQRLLLPPLDPWEATTVTEGSYTVAGPAEDTSTSSGVSPFPQQHDSQAPNWAAAAWKNAVEKVQNLMPGASSASSLLDLQGRQ